MTRPQEDEWKIIERNMNEIASKLARLDPDPERLRILRSRLEALFPANASECYNVTLTNVIP